MLFHLAPTTPVSPTPVASAAILLGTTAKTAAFPHLSLPLGSYCAAPRHTPSSSSAVTRQEDAQLEPCFAAQFICFTPRMLLGLAEADAELFACM